MIAAVQKHLDRILSHLEPQKEFINMHMVGWLSESLYNVHIPKYIRDEIETIEDVKSAIELFLQQNETPPAELIRKHQNLYNHIQHEKSFYLENLEDKLFFTHDEMLREFKRLNVPTDYLGLNVHVKEFMKDKKAHEVSVASKMVGLLAKARQNDKNTLILDVGDGKGYLSTRVALEFSLKTLGIDASQQNVKEAELRNEKLTNLWPHLVKKEAERRNVDAPEIDESMLDEKNYRTVASYIYSDTNLDELVDQAYPDECFEEICLIGLHTCGNLGANSLKHFIKSDRIKMVMNVPCCYNLLFEEFEKDFFNEEERVNDQRGDFGFPLSNFMRNKEYRIGRNARMLATQCLDKVLNGSSYPDNSLYYRTIFEKLLRERFRKGMKKHVFKLGKIRRVKSLEEYLKKACAKLNIKYDLTEEEINQLEIDHKMDKELINLHYLIRLLSSKTIESLIHLDRLLFMLESDVKHVYLVKLFDSVISPRNFAIIAVK